MRQPQPHPFLKWAGGKSQLVNELMRHAPATFAGYLEPFLGSGALFFRLARDGRAGRSVLSDANRELIDAYAAVRDRVDDVIAHLSRFSYSQEVYYGLRSQDPRALDLPLRAARMIYLNKTGYNGLYRVNRKGQFNVPFGRHRSPRYCDPDNLRAVAAALKGVAIECAPFEMVLERAQPGDLVYFDPPYVPLSATARFTAYYPGGFSLDDQRRLRDVCAQLEQRAVYVMLSNSDTEIVRTLYSLTPFAVSSVQANRAINSRAERRGKAAELIVTNYLPPLSGRANTGP